jgi:hypothetical protein
MSYNNMNNSGYGNNTNNSNYGNNMNNSGYANNMNNSNMQGQNTSGMQGRRTGAAGKGPDMICKSKSTTLFTSNIHIKTVANQIQSLTNSNTSLVAKDSTIPRMMPKTAL